MMRADFSMIGASCSLPFATRSKSWIVKACSASSSSRSRPGASATFSRNRGLSEPVLEVGELTYSQQEFDRDLRRRLQQFRQQGLDIDAAAIRRARRRRPDHRASSHQPDAAARNMPTSSVSPSRRRSRSPTSRATRRSATATGSSTATSSWLCPRRERPQRGGLCAAPSGRDAPCSSCSGRPSARCAMPPALVGPGLSPIWTRRAPPKCWSSPTPA